MPITGIYFVPCNPNATTALGTITERLHTSLADEPIPVGRWALEHKLMRDTPSCLPASASASASQRPPQPRYMQFLSMSYCSTHGFIYTSEGADSPNQNQNQNQNEVVPDQAQNQNQMVMTTVPHQSYNTLFHHFIYACQPFWCHRHTVTVPSGLVYDVGDFRIRIGDVRQTQPTARVRGTVVVVEWRGPSLITSIAAHPHRKADAGEDDVDKGIDADADADADSGIEMAVSDITDSDIDTEYATTAALIREFWARLGVDGARETILVPGLGKEVKELLRRWRKSGDVREDRDAEVEVEGVDEARQFMEIFRFNR